MGTGSPAAPQDLFFPSLLPSHLLFSLTCLSGQLWFLHPIQNLHFCVHYYLPFLCIWLHTCTAHLLSLPSRDTHLCAFVLTCLYLHATFAAYFFTAPSLPSILFPSFSFHTSMHTLHMSSLYHLKACLQKEGRKWRRRRHPISLLSKLSSSSLIMSPAHSAFFPPPSLSQLPSLLFFTGRTGLSSPPLLFPLCLPHFHLSSHISTHLLTFYMHRIIPLTSHSCIFLLGRTGGGVRLLACTPPPSPGWQQLFDHLGKGTEGQDGQGQTLQTSSGRRRRWPRTFICPLALGSQHFQARPMCLPHPCAAQKASLPPHLPTCLLSGASQ